MTTAKQTLTGTSPKQLPTPLSGDQLKKLKGGTGEAQTSIIIEDTVNL